MTGSPRDDLWGMMMGDDVENSATRRDAVITLWLSFLSVLLKIILVL